MISINQTSATNSFLSEWAQHVLRSERHFTDDREYARNLSKLIRTVSGEQIWLLQSRPLLNEVEVALRRVCQSSSSSQPVWADLLDQLFQQKQRLPSPRVLVADLRSSAWSIRFLARHTLIELGGQAVEALRTVPQRQAELVIRLLENIEIETKARWADKTGQLICPECLVHCREHNESTSWRSTVTFYGCRICQQSRNFIHCPQGVVAVLDTGWNEVHRLEDNVLRVNWLNRREIFDFDSVEIIHATDEDVERFATHVGNDTDPFRRPQYKHMKCMLAPGCRLSKNSLRILKSMVGHVESMGEAE